HVDGDITGVVGVIQRICAAAAIDRAAQAAAESEEGALSNGEGVVGGAADEILHVAKDNVRVKDSPVGRGDLPGVVLIGALERVRAGTAVQCDGGVSWRETLNVEGVVAAAGPNLEALQR